MKRRQESVEVTRRSMLKTGASLALGSVLGCPENTSAGPSSGPKSVYEAIGVKHVINATGTVTTLGGSLMPPEVIAAWSDAAKHFVDIFDPVWHGGGRKTRGDPKLIKRSRTLAA